MARFTVYKSGNIMGGTVTISDLADKAAKDSADRKATPYLVRMAAQGRLRAMGHSQRTIHCAEGVNSPLWQRAVKATGAAA